MRNPALRRNIDKFFNPALMSILALAIVPLLLLDLSAKLTPTGSKEDSPGENSPQS